MSSVPANERSVIPSSTWLTSEAFTAERNAAAPNRHDKQCKQLFGIKFPLGEFVIGLSQENAAVHPRSNVMFAPLFLHGELYCHP